MFTRRAARRGPWWPAAVGLEGLAAREKAPSQLVVKVRVVLQVDEVDHVGPICHEDSAQEEIDKIHLPDDIDEIEKVAEEIPINYDMKED